MDKSPGQRFIAAIPDGWRPGMRTILNGQRGRLYQGTGGCLCWQGENGPGFVADWPGAASIFGGVLDLEDGASRGTALEVLRERMGDPLLHLSPAPGWWMLDSGADVLMAKGRSEAEALADGAEAWRRGQP